MLSSDMPYNKELKYSMRDVTNAWITVTSASYVKNDFKQWMFFGW